MIEFITDELNIPINDCHTNKQCAFRAFDFDPICCFTSKVKRCHVKSVSYLTFSSVGHKE